MFFWLELRSAWYRERWVRPRRAHHHQDGGRADRVTVIFASVCGLYDKSMTTLLMLGGGGMHVLQLLG
ncbi:MAG: hypothetical protein ABS37_07500 [Acidovorax sp. SCN 65-108]|nr:MAG: hypothetical protein ABS37_07500 [Acidovorax sp. SCN 65-108]OJV72464.1 MAG: hypothetical protein BGO35_05385 [Burkholderiales bacterium 64-34]